MKDAQPARRKRKPIDEAWASVAAQNGGSVRERRGVVKSFDVPYRGWTLTVERYSADGSTTWTRVRTRFATRMPLRLTIARDTPFHRLGRALGMQDIVAGNPAFDRAFNVRADCESMVRSLLLNRAITDRMLKDRAARLELRPVRGGQRGAARAELRFYARPAKDTATLEAILDLVHTVLDGLERVGVARNEND